MTQVEERLQQVESRLLSEQLKQEFGYYLLCLGKVDLSAIQASPITYHVVVNRDAAPEVSVQSYWQQMPFANECMDVVVLSHVLADNPQSEAVVWEAKRVLRHDGTLLIFGYNAWRMRSKPSVSLWRLDQWLQKHGLQVQKAMSYGFFSGKSNSRWERSMCRWIPWLCKGHLLVVKKRTIALNPLTIKDFVLPIWNKKAVVTMREKHE
jgi:SAM-dependent methyltransferase